MSLNKRAAAPTDGLRPRAPQPSPVRAQPRPLAPRQRLAVRSGHRYVPAAAGNTARLGGRRSAGTGHHRLHARAREPACGARIRRRARGLLRPATQGVRRGGRHVHRDAGRAPDPARGILARPAAEPARVVSIGERRLGRSVSRAGRSGPHRDHRRGGDPWVPASARSRRKRAPAAPLGSGGTRAPVRATAGGMLAPRVRVPSARRMGAAARRAYGKGTCRHRGIRRGSGVPVLLHRRASRRRTPSVRPIEHSPYQAYRLRSHRSGPAAVAALVRDPVASAQVWSRHEGYPGDGTYLEFHKIRWPGGLKLWRVTGNGIDLGEKQPYDPAAARGRAADHATHFVHLLDRIAHAESLGDRGDVVVAPFDTELFGHWWYEGPDFLGEVYRRFTETRDVRPTTATSHLRDRTPATTLQLAAGSWGANGDYSMWLNDETAWTWQRLWPLENAFWDAAPAALALAGARPVLAQAARELLLAQASDWQFIISTGEVADYATRRFTLHCDDAERLLAMLARDDLESGAALAEELRQRDDVFPDILPHIAAALAAPRSRGARRAKRARAKR